MKNEEASVALSRQDGFKKAIAVCLVVTFGIVVTLLVGSYPQKMQTDRTSSLELAI